MEDIAQHGYHIGYHNALKVWGRWLCSIYQGQVAYGEGVLQLVVQENVMLLQWHVMVSKYPPTVEHGIRHQQLRFHS